jgi:hypothetical protein
MDYSKEPSLRDSTINALLSGGFSGAALGSLPKLLSAARPNWRALLTSAGIGGGLGAAAAGGSTFVGSALMGTPNEDEPSGYTRRGAIGGAIGGGLVGGGLGAVTGAGKIPMEKSYPFLLKELAKRLGKFPTSKGAAIGAGIGALGGGILAGASGADEGMQLDLITNELRDAERRKQREKYGI